MNAASEFAIDLALQTGDLLRDYFSLSGLHAVQKIDQTAVTEADMAADRLITIAINSKFPQDKIISEESSHKLDDPQTPTWIIDPLDGTTNFSLGLSIWGISIARLLNGYPELGILYFPMINELYCAERGTGAYLNHLPITTHGPEPSQPLSFFACCSRSFRYYDISVPYKLRIMGSCAYTFCMVARGSALLGFDATPKIWDLAAVWLLVEEAGGKISAFDGSPAFPISPNDNFSIINYPTLAAATPDILSFGQKKIQKKLSTLSS